MPSARFTRRIFAGDELREGRSGKSVSPDRSEKAVLGTRPPEAHGSRTSRSASCPRTDRSEIQRRSRGCKEEFGHALVPLSLPRLRRLVPLSFGLSAPLLR